MATIPSWERECLLLQVVVVKAPMIQNGAHESPMLASFSWRSLYTRGRLKWCRSCHHQEGMVHEIVQGWLTVRACFLTIFYHVQRAPMITHHEAVAAWEDAVDGGAVRLSLQGACFPIKVPAARTVPGTVPQTVPQTSKRVEKVVPRLPLELRCGCACVGKRPNLQKTLLYWSVLVRQIIVVGDNTSLGNLWKRSNVLTFLTQTQTFPSCITCL